MGNRITATELENREQVRGLEELTTLQQEQLEVQRREIDHLSSSVRSLQIQPREDTPQGSGQREATTNKTTQPIKIVDSSTGNALLPHKSTTPQPTVPTAITFNWTTCKDIPGGMSVYDHPVAINGKVYMRGESNMTVTVLVYTPDQDSWDKLPPPPVDRFTIHTTLRGRLLVVGGRDKSTKKNTNTILTFDESSRQWVQSLPRMPKALTVPAVVEYQNHLIVIGRCDSNARIADVNILNTSNKWITAKPLPSTGDYSTCLKCGDTLYLVGQDTKEVFRAHVPSLISRASSGVWESVASVPFYWSSPIAIGNTLLTVGGSDETGVIATSSIHLYDPTKDQWTQCGDLPEKMYCCTCNCIELSGKLCVLGGRGGIFTTRSVYTSIPSITH